MRKSVGREGWEVVVEVMEMRPWGVSRVNDGMVG